MKSRNGFTMVELLAVIVILSIIMVILIPAVSNVSKNTKESILQSKISTIETSASKYGDDNINTYQKCTNALESGGIDIDAYKDCIISVDDLVGLGYLEYDTTKGNASFIGNPVTGDRIDGTVLLCYNAHTISIDAIYYEKDSEAGGMVHYSCPAVSESGNYSLSIGSYRKDFYWGTHETFKTKIYTKGNFKSLTCETTGPFTCDIEDNYLNVTLDDSGTPSSEHGYYFVYVDAVYEEGGEEHTLYASLNTNYYVVSYDVEGYTRGMCMKTLTSETYRVKGSHTGDFSVSGTSDDLNATIKDKILYMNSGSNTGEKTFRITEGNAGLTKDIVRQVYKLSVDEHVTNVIVGDVAKRIKLNAGGTGKITVTLDSNAASISANNSSFSTSIVLTNQDYFYIKGNSIGTVVITIKGELCGEVTEEVNVSNIRLDNTDIPKYLYFNGGTRQNNDKTQFKSKISGSLVNDFSCTVYKNNNGKYVENTDYLNCRIENDTIILETTNGENVYNDVSDFKINIKSESQGSLDIYIPIIYKTSLYFKKNGDTVTKICKNVSDYNTTDTIMISGSNLGVLDTAGKSCDGSVNNIVFDSMTDYYLVNLGNSSTNPSINYTNNCASSGGTYGNMALKRHRVTSEQLSSSLPYKIDYNNTGKSVILLRENNGNRLGELDYHVYSLESEVSSLTLGVNTTSTRIKITYAATGRLNYNISSGYYARVNIISRDTFSYDPDNINKVFTDVITISTYRTGSTSLVISGDDCGKLTIPINVMNVFAINLDGGKYGTVKDKTLTCMEQNPGKGCYVTLPDFTVDDGITKLGWSTNINGGNNVSIGKSILLDNRNKGTTYYAIANNPIPNCMFSNVPSDIYGTTSLYLTCSDIGGGLESSDITINSLSVNNDKVRLESISKTNDTVANGYRYEIKVNPNGYYGPFRITLNDGVVSDKYGLTNKEATTGDIVSAENEYVNYYLIGKNNSSDVIAFLYQNKVLGNASSGYTLKVYGESEMKDFTTAPWDNYASKITDIAIASGITSIGKNAFYGVGITNISIPDSVSLIGESAFESTSLKMLNVNAETISKRSFANNLDLSTLTIGSNVRTIDQYAFSTNTSLSDITFNEGVKYIREYAFIDSNLGDLVMPKSLETIGDYAFYNFKGESVDISNAYVGIAPFRGVNFKEVKASTLEVDNNIVYNGEILIFVPDKLEGEIPIREGTTTIIFDSLNGFVNDDNKKMSLYMPASVTSIESRINLNISSIEVDANNENYASKDGVLYNKDLSNLISIPSYYPKAEYTIDSASISSYAMMNNITLNTVYLTSNVKSIGSSAIYGRTPLGIKKVVNDSNVLFSMYYYDVNYSLDITSSASSSGQ